MNDQISIPAGNAKTEELEFISLEEAAAMTSGTRVTFILVFKPCMLKH